VGLLDEVMMMRKMQSARWRLGFVVLAAASCDLPALPDLPPFGLELLAGDIGGRGNVDGVDAAARFNLPSDVAIDSAGNVYVADSDNHVIRKITAAGVVTTLAGSAGLSGSANGQGAEARFDVPSGIAVDGAGNVYVADTINYTIRKVTADGFVTTLAGTARTAGSANGMGAAARFAFPRGVAVDSAGDVYVADSDNHTIRKVTADGIVITLAGTAGMAGSANDTGAAARFDRPTDVAVDSAGNVYTADSGSTIRKITPGGVVTTLAGTTGMFGSANGTGAAARFHFDAPAGLAVDSVGDVYFADRFNHTIRKITAGGVVTTLAGIAGMIGSANGTGDARFFSPSGVAVDSAGNVYVADRDNHTIRKITAGGVVTTLAGTAGMFGSANDTGSAARFVFPLSAAVDSAGNVYVADAGNNAIRKVTSAGMVTLLAGAGQQGSEDGTGSAARFALPSGVAVDGAGNVYVADEVNHAIRKVTADGVVSTLAGGTPGTADDTGTAAKFGFPSGVAVDDAGNVYVSDTGNHTIRKITADRVVITLAGAGGMSGSADGTGAAARFNRPSGVAIDGAGNIYVADTNNSTIRRITPAGTTTTVAGTAGVAGVLLGARPRFALPRGLAIVGDSLVISDGHAILLLRHGVQ
jgi:sugar lactone lactonase YvrE